MGGLLGDDNGVIGHQSQSHGGQEDKTAYEPEPESAAFAGTTGAGATGLEPATSGVTGRRSNQLSYAPEMFRMGHGQRPGRES